MATGPQQSRGGIAQAVRQPVEQWQRECDHVAVDRAAEAKAVHAHRRDDLYGRLVDFGDGALHVEDRMTRFHVHELAEIRMPVLRDFPVVHTAALRYRLAMQQIRRGPCLPFTKEL